MKRVFLIFRYALLRTSVVLFITLTIVEGAMNLMGIKSTDRLTTTQSTELLVVGLFVAVFAIIAQEKIAEMYSHKTKK